MRLVILAAVLLLSACAAPPGSHSSAGVPTIPAGAPGAPDAGLDFLSRLAKV